MLLVTGILDRVTEREAGRPGETWIERQLVIRDWGTTQYVKIGSRDFGPDPSPGDLIAVEVSVDAYVSKKDGRAGFSLTGWRRNAETEAALNAAQIRSVKAG
jgi:hypothetical protein